MLVANSQINMIHSHKYRCESHVKRLEGKFLLYIWTKLKKTKK